MPAGFEVEADDHFFGLTLSGTQIDFGQARFSERLVVENSSILLLGEGRGKHGEGIRILNRGEVTSNMEGVTLEEGFMVQRGGVLNQHTGLLNFDDSTSSISGAVNIHGGRLVFERATVEGGRVRQFDGDVLVEGQFTFGQHEDSALLLTAGNFVLDRGIEFGDRGVINFLGGPGSLVLREHQP